LHPVATIGSNNTPASIGIVGSKRERHGITISLANPPVSPQGLEDQPVENLSAPRMGSS